MVVYSDARWRVRQGRKNCEQNCRRRQTQTVSDVDRDKEMKDRGSIMPIMRPSLGTKVQTEQKQQGSMKTVHVTPKGGAVDDSPR